MRQAYDDFAQPGRLMRELLVLPLALRAVAGRRWDLVLGGLVAVVTVAEVGRRRSGGAAVYDRAAALWAPLWLAERAITVWVALGLRLRGGVRYRDARLSRAANSLRRLRRAASGVERGMKEESYGRAA